MSVVEVMQVQPTDDDSLRAWDWVAELKREDRSVSWLARKTNRPESTVHAYKQGRYPAPIEWLREAAQVMGKGAAA
jgi:hypothetical protein